MQTSIKLKVNKKFKALLPPLMPGEKAGLEESLLAEGCRDPFVTWRGTIVDGHNRYEICTRHGIDFEVTEKDFENETAAMVWMIDNQKDRRNLTPAQRLEMGFKKAGLLAPKAKANLKQAGKQHGRGKPCPTLDNPIDPIDTIQTAAEFAGTSRATASKYKKVVEKADTETKTAVLKGDVSINQAYKEVKKEERREAQQSKNAELFAREVEPPTGEYDVIVIDPPWPMKKIERDCRPNQVSELDYPTMSEDELREFSLPMAEDCHVFLWTTHKFLPMALRLIQSWRLKYVCTLVWHKPGGFQPVGLPQYNCEFAIYARRGSPTFIDTKKFPVCFEAPRGRHSEKPEEFYKTLRRVTAGARIDIFNRRKIEGFHPWGNEGK